MRVLEFFLAFCLYTTWFGAERACYSRFDVENCFWEIALNIGFFIFIPFRAFLLHDKSLSLMLDFTKGQIIKHQT
jgi:hypothetical protein